MPATEAAASDQKTSRESPLKNAILLTISAVAILIAGYYIYQQLYPPNPWRGEITDDPRETNFDEITADQLLDLPLTNAAGQAVSLRERVGKNLVIVVTRGSLASVAQRDKGWIKPEFPNVCPYCSSQTSGIASRLADFTSQDAEVLVIFPVSKPAEQSDADDLLKPAGVNIHPMPFPVLFDLNLQAMDKLQLKAHLARPASFIIDRAGHLRFAYVANVGSADRPSAGELLRHLTSINTEPAPAAAEEKRSAADSSENGPS